MINQGGNNVEKIDARILISKYEYLAKLFSDDTEKYFVFERMFLLFFV